MPSRYYDFGYETTTAPVWKQSVFPGAQIQTIPNSEGIYRFKEFVNNSCKTLFVEISRVYDRQTIRDCYQFHDIDSHDNTSHLKPMYATLGIQFEHSICSLDEAKKFKAQILRDERPAYPGINFIVDDQNSEPAF